VNIAVFTKSTTFHKGHGGLETQNKVLCEGLARKGHKITVFSPKNAGTGADLVENGVSYVFITCSYRYFLSSLNKNSWFNRSYEIFDRFHKQKAYDLVIGQSSAAIGVIARREDHRVPVVSISHGTTLGELKTQLNNLKSIKDVIKILKDGQYVLRQFFGRQRDFVLKSNQVIAVSNAVKRNLIEETFVPEENVSVINNGINPESFISVKDGRSFQGNGVLFVGQLTKDKGIDFLVDTFLDSTFENYELYILGDGPLKEELEQKILAHHVESRIKLLGKIPYSEVVNYYLNPQITVFAFPTKREEGLPMVLVEAMFAGLPVVAFNKGGVEDIVKNQFTGYVIEPGKPQEFRQQLKVLLNDTNLLQKFSKNALDNAYAALTLDVMIEKYEDIFRKVTKQ